MTPLDTLKPKRSLTVPISLLILSTAVLFFTFPLAVPHLRTLRYPRCGHIILVSAARHGSSWFLDSAERCAANGTFRHLNYRSELWNLAQPGPVVQLSPLQAADYAASNHSLKIFPLAYYGNGSELRVFFDEARVRKLPVFLLTRRLDASYASLLTATESQEWNAKTVEHSAREAARNGTRDKPDVEHGDGLGYKNRIDNFFRGVRAMMVERGVEWDEFDYDSVVEQRVIVGERNQCSIRNCNF